MGKVVFEISPAEESEIVPVTRAQLKTILKESRDSDVRVLSHTPASIVEVYVGPFYHELTRHHVDAEGRVMFTEEDPNDTGEWQ